MAYKLTVLDGVLLDLHEAVAWYNEIQPELAKDLVRKFQQTLDELLTKPLQSQQQKGYRKLNLQRFPYKVVFKIIKQEIVVIAFAHHSRKPSYWKK